MNRTERLQRVRDIVLALEARVQQLPTAQRKRYHISTDHSKPLRINITFTVPRPDQISRVIRWLESEGMRVADMPIFDMFVTPDIIKIPCDFVGR